MITSLLGTQLFGTFASNQLFGTFASNQNAVTENLSNFRNHNFEC